jgi:terminal-alkyne amino-acid exporter
MASSPYRARAALLVPVVLWAVAFPAIRVGVAGYGPAALSVLRLGVASAVLLLVAPLLGVRRPSWGDVPLILLSWGEVHVAAGTASLIVATNPIYSAVIAVVVLGERMHPRQAIGAAVALAGTAAIATAQGGLRLERSAAVVLAAAIAFGVYHTAIKPLLGRYSGLEVTAYATWAGTLLLAPAIPTLIEVLPHAGTRATLAAVFLGLAPSALGFVSWGYAVARLPVTVAAGSLYLAPPIAVLVGYVWLGETPRLVELLGGAVAIAGVALANSRPRPAAEPARSPAGTQAAKTSP